MRGRYQPYPDLWRPKLGFIAADATMFLWIVLCIYIGSKVHDAFWTLHVLADAVMATGTGVAETGQQIDRVVTGVQSVASNLAGIDVALRNALGAVLTLISLPMDTAGKTLETIGQQLTQALQELQHNVESVLGVGSILRTAIDPLLALAQKITDLGGGVLSVGQDLQKKVRDLQQTAETLPTIRAGLFQALTPLHSLPHGIIAIGRGTVAQGQQELVAIGNLAQLMGGLAAAVPVCLALRRYVPWRLSATRSFRYLDAILRQPGATEVPATMQYLAGRAIYTLPYDRLVHYTRDPIGDWLAGHYHQLARAAMAEEGLDLKRYVARQRQE